MSNAGDEGTKSRSLSFDWHQHPRLCACLKEASPIASQGQQSLLFRHSMSAEDNAAL